MNGTEAPSRWRGLTPGAVPRLLVLTDRRRSEEVGRGLVGTVSAAVRAGAPAVLLREKDLPADERRALARDLAAVTAEHGARLFVASDVGLARAVGADGVHLAAADATVAPSGRQLDDGRTEHLVVGRSCHDAAEVTEAAREGVDYVTVSPVAPTTSKPGYGPALGRHGVAALVAAAGDLPVLALGGVGPDDVAPFRAAGAHGVAVMGAVMGARDPAEVVARLLQQLTEEEAP